MVKVLPALWSTTIFHKRMHPKKNSFKYRAFYLVLDMLKPSLFDNRFFSMKKKALLQYKDEDHGHRKKESALEWAKPIFLNRKIHVDSIRLITLPRVFGYVFNPVSFWLGFSGKDLMAVICEVNNTFGQSHSYVCYDTYFKPISYQDIYLASKIFHVSPFYPSQGEYHFRFDFNDEKDFYKILIHYYDSGVLQLITSMQGKVKTMTRRAILKEFFLSPLVGLKVIFLIHFQALKLFFKKTKFHSLPEQSLEKISDALKINH